MIKSIHDKMQTKSRPNEPESKIAVTLSKIKETGAEDYFNDKWGDELVFNKNSEISKFLIDMALFGDEKFFSDSIFAMNSMIYYNTDVKETGYLKSFAVKCMYSNDERAKALGVSIIDESFSFDEKLPYGDYIKWIIRKPYKETEFSSIIKNASISILIDTETENDLYDFKDIIYSSTDKIKLKAIGALSPKVHSSAEVLNGLAQPTPTASLQKPYWTSCIMIYRRWIRIP